MAKEPIAYALDAEDYLPLKRIIDVHAGEGYGNLSRDSYRRVFAQLQLIVQAAVPLYVPYAELPPAAREPEA